MLQVRSKSFLMDKIIFDFFFRACKQLNYNKIYVIPKNARLFFCYFYKFVFYSFLDRNIFTSFYELLGTLFYSFIYYYFYFYSSFYCLNVYFSMIYYQINNNNVQNCKALSNQIIKCYTTYTNCIISCPWNEVTRVNLL